MNPEKNINQNKVLAKIRDIRVTCVKIYMRDAKALSMLNDKRLSRKRNFFRQQVVGLQLKIFRHVVVGT